MKSAIEMLRVLLITYYILVLIVVLFTAAWFGFDGIAYTFQRAPRDQQIWEVVALFGPVPLLIVAWTMSRK